MRRRIGMALVLAAAGSLAFSGDSERMPTAAEIAARMEQMDTWRNSALRAYTVLRHYELENTRFHKRAQMTVEVTYTYPGNKHFRVLEASGSTWVRQNVLKRLLESEVEAYSAEYRRQTRINRANYHLELLGRGRHNGRDCFILTITPKRPEKYLVRGRIWVDAQDYAITRIEGTPAKNPSFWTHDIKVVHEYRKIGPYWLSASIYTKTEVRIFGSTVVKIDYFDYELNPGESAREAKPGREKGG